MSILSSVFHSLLHKPTDNAHYSGSQYAIPYSSFVNAFQLLNSSMFDIEANPEKTSADIDITAAIYEMWGSPVAAHLQDKERFNPTSYSYWSNNDYGLVISFLEYKYTEIEHGEKEWGTLMMASPQMVEGELNIVPHVVFSGFYQSMPDGQLVICPREVVCLGFDDNGPVLNSMTDIHEVVCAFAYMDRVLIQMMSGSKVNDQENMKVFSPEEFEKTKAAVNSLFRRGYSDLEKQVTLYLESHPEAAKFEIPAP